MPTIIDQIIVELNLDPKGFDQGVKRQAEAWLKTRQEAAKTGKEVGEATDKLAQSFANLGLKVAGFIASFLAVDKLASFGANLVQANISLRNLSSTTQISVETLSQWEQVAERGGSSVESMRAAILGMDKAIKSFDAAGSDSDLGKMLLNLHRRGVDVSRDKPEGGRKTATEMITDILAAMEKLHFSEADKTRAFRQLGMMDDSVIALFNKGLESFQEQLKAQKDIGVVTNENVDAAEKLNNAWFTMTQRVENLGRAMLQTIINPLLRLFGSTTQEDTLKAQEAVREENRKAGIGGPSPYDQLRDKLRGSGPSQAPGNPAGDQGGTGGALDGGAKSGSEGTAEPSKGGKLGGLTVGPGLGASALSSLGINQNQWDAFRKGMANIESSGGNYQLMGGAGRKYAGAYQLSREEIDRAAKSFGEQSPSTSQFLGDKGMQERYFDAITRMNHEQLMRNPKYAAMSPTDQLKILGYAHNQGVGGTNKFLSTGQVGRDAFGTPGTRYINEIDKQLKGSGGDAFERGGTPLPLLSNPRLLRAPRFNMGYGQGGNYSSSETVVHSMIVNGATKPTDDAYGIATDATQSLERGRWVQQFTTGPM
jgi:hypothetical protein